MTSGVPAALPSGSESRIHAMPVPVILPSADTTNRKTAFARSSLLQYGTRCDNACAAENGVVTFAYVLYVSPADRKS